ncbi:MAG: cupin domain-containing protein [Burkholderiales bacterium]
MKRSSHLPPAGAPRGRGDPAPAADDTVEPAPSAPPAGPRSSAPIARQRRQLAERAAASARASRAMVTERYAAAAMARANAGARLQTLYLAAEGPRRPGEPLNVLLIELAPSGVLEVDPPAAGVLREWLLVRGGVTLADPGQWPVALAPLDFHVVPASLAPPNTAPAPTRLDAGASGALLFLREAHDLPDPAEPSRTVRDADTAWKPFAPKVERRVLWRRGPLAAMLYRAAPGAAVPHHGHGHDEECLVLRGETFQDDTLLREGDYQLAPAGSAHLSGSTDSGAIFYIHGDLNLELRGPAA